MLCDGSEHGEEGGVGGAVEDARTHVYVDADTGAEDSN